MSSSVSVSVDSVISVIYELCRIFHITFTKCTCKCSGCWMLTILVNNDSTLAKKVSPIPIPIL